MNWPIINISADESPGLVTDFPIWKDHHWKIPKGIEVRRAIINGIDTIAFWDGKNHVSGSLDHFSNVKMRKCAIRNLDAYRQYQKEMTNG